MPRCRIDIEASPTFQKLLRRYQRQYPKTKADLEDAFARIEQDPQHAAHATPLIGFERAVWKYRCKQSDLQRGAQGGYRIIALYEAGTGVLYPILLYAKRDREDVASEQVTWAIQELQRRLEEATGDRPSPEE